MTQYEVISNDSGSLKMVSFEPSYFKSQVSTETKDKAKEKGLVFWDDSSSRIILTDPPSKFKSALDALGLETYLDLRVRGGLNE